MNTFNAFGRERRAERPTMLLNVAAELLAARPGAVTLASFGFLALVAVILPLLFPEAAFAFGWNDIKAGFAGFVDNIKEHPVLTVLGGPLAPQVAELAEDILGDPIAAMLQSADEALLTFSQSIVTMSTDVGLLDAEFDALFADTGILELVKTIHKTVVIPVATLVLAIFTFTGIADAAAKFIAADTNGTTGDYAVPLMFYGVGQVIIFSSWEIMEFIYALSRLLVTKILTTGVAEMEAMDGVDLSAVEDSGLLLLIMIIALIGVIITMVSSVVAQGSIIYRAAQIYIYTALSPIPLAFLASESGRQLTKSFFQRYIAICLSGAIIALLFVMYGMVVGNIPSPPEGMETQGDLFSYLVALVLSFATHVVFILLFFKSGSIARDLVGA